MGTHGLRKHGTGIIGVDEDEELHGSPNNLLTLPNIATTGTLPLRPKTKLLLCPTTTVVDEFPFYDRQISMRDRTRADPEPRYLPIRDVYGIGEGGAEGAQAGSTNDTYLWLEVFWDALSEEFETSIERKLSVAGHIVPRELERERSGQSV